MATTLFGHTWAELPERARAILRQVIEDTADMDELAAELGCSRPEALEQYLAAKRALGPSWLDAPHRAGPPTGEQLLRALKRLPADLRSVAFRLVVEQATMAETAARLGISPGDVYERFALALTRLEVELPGLQRLIEL